MFNSCDHNKTGTLENDQIDELKMLILNKFPRFGGDRNGYYDLLMFIFCFIFFLFCISICHGFVEFLAYTIRLCMYMCISVFTRNHHVKHVAKALLVFIKPSHHRDVHCCSLKEAV